jgi:group I intron endonuclease
MAYVYRHIRLDKNEPFYIGIGSKENHNRAYIKSDRNNIWKKIVSKSDYRVEILIDDLTWQEACEKEKEFIFLYGRINLNNGTLSNLTDGGDGVYGMVLSKESKNKIGKANKGKLSGDKNPFYGKKHSDEFKLKISKFRKDNYSGENHPKYGKLISEETKNKISKSNIGKMAAGKHPRSKIILDLCTGIYYDYSGDAAKALNINKATLTGYLCGNRKNKTNLIYA